MARMVVPRALAAAFTVCVTAATFLAGAAGAQRPVVVRPDPLNRALAFVDEAHRVGDYIAWRAERDAMLNMLATNDAFLASLYTPPPPPAPTTASNVQSRTSGGHSDAWWQGVATCEQGGRNDPYFGYFSFMDGSQGGQPWSEQVAAGNALLARSGAERESDGGPWADSCINAGYAASPSG